MAVHAGRLFYLHVKLQYLCACVKFELRENLKNHFVGLHNYIFHFFNLFNRCFFPLVVLISPRKTGEDFISDVFTFITDGNHVSKMVQISDSCDKR